MRKVKTYSQMKRSYLKGGTREQEMQEQKERIKEILEKGVVEVKERAAETKKPVTVCVCVYCI